MLCVCVWCVFTLSVVASSNSMMRNSSNSFCSLNSCDSFKMTASLFSNWCMRSNNSSVLLFSRVCENRKIPFSVNHKCIHVWITEFSFLYFFLLNFRSYTLVWWWGYMKHGIDFDSIFLSDCSQSLYSIIIIIDWIKSFIIVKKYYFENKRFVYPNIHADCRPEWTLSNDQHTLHML